VVNSDRAADPMHRPLLGVDHPGIYPNPEAGFCHRTVDSRQERVAKNEARHRELNEEIEESYESHSGEDYMDVVCECGIADCDVFLKVTKAEYEDIRADAGKFILFRDHFVPDVDDDIVLETDRFVVVAKREGADAEIATATDPRG
jgi:hypothetical protein